MEKFNAKDYAINDDLDVLVREGPKEEKEPNYTVSLLPDGKKGFIINRAKKSMAVDYENGQFLDEAGKVMDADNVCKFMAALSRTVIQLPMESGFTRIMKGKAKVLELYNTVTRRISEEVRIVTIAAPAEYAQELMPDLIINGFAFINICESTEYDYLPKYVDYERFNAETLKRVSPVLCHYMTPVEMAMIISNIFWKSPLPAEIETRKIVLFDGFTLINYLLEHYSPEEIFIYLDEWMVSIQHRTFPDVNAAKALFEGMEVILKTKYKRTFIFTDIDILDGSNYKYSGHIDDIIFDRDTPASNVMYPHKKESIISLIPSREAIEIPINEFTQMAIYGAIAQGYATNLNEFFSEWRAFIDYQLYFEGGVTEYAPKSLLTANAIYKQREADVIAQTVSNAYRVKRSFYESEIRRLRIPVPFEIEKGIMVTLASEKDVLSMVQGYYLKEEPCSKLWDIMNMFRKNVIPMSLISKDGVLCTRFFDIVLMSGVESDIHRHYYYQGKKYECAALADTLVMTLVTSYDIQTYEWVIPMPEKYDECKGLNGILEQNNEMMFLEYFKKNIRHK